jgi:hypothetical protein
MTQFTSRPHESVMMVTQNNDTRSITMLGMSENLQHMLGYDEPLTNIPLQELLGERTQTLLKEYVEYTDDECDVLEVLSKHRHMKLRTQRGTEILLECHISRAATHDKHHLFRFVLCAPETTQSNHSLTQALKESFEGHMVVDEATHLPNAESMLKFLSMTQDFLEGNRVDACFLYMVLASESLDTATKRDHALRHIGQVVARNLRGEDTVGRVGDHALGIILVDVNKATVPMVVNRLRHMILSDPISTEEKGYATPTVRQAAVMIGESKPEDVFLTCMEMLDGKPEEHMVFF